MRIWALVLMAAGMLLAGCQRSDQKEPAKTLTQSGKELADSLKKGLGGGLR